MAWERALTRRVPMYTVQLLLGREGRVGVNVGSMAFPYAVHSRVADTPARGDARCGESSHICADR